MQRSLAQFKKSNAPYEKAISLLILSEIQTKLNDIEDAKQNRARAEELFLKLGAGTKMTAPHE